MSNLSQKNFLLEVVVVKNEDDSFEQVEDLIEFVPDDAEFEQYEYIEIEEASIDQKNLAISADDAKCEQNVSDEQKYFTVKLEADRVSNKFWDRNYRCSNKKCKLEDVGFDTQYELDQHNDMHLQLMEVNQCPICNKILANKKKFSSHMDTRHTLKNFVCDNCGKSFKSKDNLRLHMSHHRKYFLVECRACKKSYKSMQSLRYHLRQHFEHHQCETCGAVFEHKKLLMGHIAAKHDHDLMLQCRFCTRMFSRNDVREAHEREIHKNGQIGSHFKCQECDSAFDFRDDLMNHKIRSHYSGFVHTCEECGKIFKKKSLLDLHKNSHKEKSVQCDSCKMMFTFVTALRKHRKLGRCKGPAKAPLKDSLTREEVAKIAKQQLEEITVNPIRKISTNSFEDVQEFVETVEKIKKKPGRKKKEVVEIKKEESSDDYEAAAPIIMKKPTRKSAITIKTISEPELDYYRQKVDSGITFSSSGRAIKKKLPVFLAHHTFKQINIPKKSNVSFECDKCGKAIESKVQLTSHLNNHVRLQKHKCEICDKPFGNLAALKKHCMMAHRNDNPFKQKKFQCELCPKRYLTEFLLAQHRLSHENRKSQKCTQCNFATNALYDLKNHIKRIHNATKDFLCPEEGCGKAFKRRCDMENHRKTVHTDIKIYVKCPVCDVIVLEKGLQSHMINRHSEKAKQKPFVCQVCGRAERYEKNLQRHYEAVHEPVNRGVIYPCNECPQTFFRRRELTAHSFEHFTGIVYECQECGNKYKSKKELTNHHYTHKFKEFPCPMCNTIFQTKSGRAKHMKKYDFAIELKMDPQNEYKLEPERNDAVYIE